jgi:hypothetical protein
MTTGIFVTITLMTVAWSLWIRRLTWTCRWEVAASINIVLQGVAIFLISPVASATLGSALHRVTGLWNLQAYLGHDCYVVAASAVVYNTLGRLGDGTATHILFTRYVEYPATVCIPLMLASFTLSSGPARYAPDFFAVRTDGWLTVYWMVLCTTLVHLLVFGSWALRTLRRDPRSRRIANFYLLASASGVFACAVRVTTALIPSLQGHPLSTLLVWLFACGCGAGFALASGYSWRLKTRWFARAA